MSVCTTMHSGIPGSACVPPPLHPATTAKVITSQRSARPRSPVKVRPLELTQPQPFSEGDQDPPRLVPLTGAVCAEPVGAAKRRPVFKMGQDPDLVLLVSPARDKGHASSSGEGVSMAAMLGVVRRGSGQMAGFMSWMGVGVGLGRGLCVSHCPMRTGPASAWRTTR